MSLVLPLVALGTLLPLVAGANAPRELSVNRLSEPEGVPLEELRFSWKLDPGFGKRQSASQVRIRANRANGDLVWDSGRAEGSESLEVCPSVTGLEPSRVYFWQVRVWNEDGRLSGWSEPQRFTTALGPNARARWIGPASCTRPDADLGDAQWVTTGQDSKGLARFRRSFEFPGAGPDEVVELLHAENAKARLEINGKCAGEFGGMGADGRHLRFQDVARFLKKGQNEMSVALGPGESPMFIAALAFPDGRRLVTDAAWGRCLGGVRETPFGRSLVMRREIASPAFERAFTVRDCPVESAVLHVTGLGFYEMSLNGKKIGSRVLDPAPTAYDKTVYYATHDLTGLLRPGENAFRLLLGHGWYDMRTSAVWNFDAAPWRDFPRGWAQLEVRYADGARKTVITDSSWRQVTSPVGYDCIFEGEVIGAHDPEAPDLDREAIFAEEVPGPQGQFLPMPCAPARVMREILPRAVHDLGAGSCVVEFPENFSGWVRARFRGLGKGDVVSLRYDERVGRGFRPALASSPTDCPSGNGEGQVVRREVDRFAMNLASYRVLPRNAAVQCDRFVARGSGEEAYEPRFSYKGFQYVWVQGLKERPGREDFVGCFVHTSFKDVGSFDCSDPVFNELMQMADRSYRSNFTDGVPTDCPHREKNGWTGDASVASELAQYCYENTASYEKWLQDICDAQRADGNLPGIVPTGGWGFDWGNGPAWDSALSVIPWNLYLYRGDRKVLDRIYPALKRYLAYVATRETGGLVRYGLDDWVPVTWERKPSVAFTSSCHYLQALSICGLIEELRRGDGTVSPHTRKAEEVRRAIHQACYRGDGVYDNGGQTAQAVALAFGIPPEGERGKAEARLVAAVMDSGCHVDVGLIGFKHLFRALSQAGRTDLAFCMLTDKAGPSPAQWARAGSSTLWEDWTGGQSRNHVMFGDYVAWAYQYLAGIRLEESAGSTIAVPCTEAPGFRRFVVAPHVIKALDHVSASVNTPYGLAGSSWRREGRWLRFSVRVPPGTTATVRLPGREPVQALPGEHSFDVPQ